MTDAETAGAGRGYVLVGRRNELEMLLAALEMPPAVVLVEGEAGIGKSRLVQEAEAALAGRGVRVLTGFCHPLREPLPFGPVLEALRDVGEWLPDSGQLNPQAGALAPLLPGLAEHLPPVPEAAMDARAARFQLVGAVRSVLEAVGPLVLVVEDVHWADEATRELLLLLGRDLPQQLGLVLTYRREDLPADTPVLGVPYRRPAGTSGTDIPLKSLTEQDVQNLAGAVLGPRANAALGRVLYLRSGGLPLVVEEDLLTLVHREPRGATDIGTRGRSQGAARVSDSAVLELSEVPRQLRETVIGRMATLSPSAIAVVRAAAVLAVSAGQDLLTTVTGLGTEQGADGLLQALRASVLRENQPARYGFRHALAQKAVYGDIPGPQREDLHRRAVEALQAAASPSLVQIAYHVRALGDMDTWLLHAEAAADQAIALGDEGTAAAVIHDILSQSHLPDDLRTRSALALARIAFNSVDYTTSVTVLRRILVNARLSAPVRGEIRLSLGRLLTNHAQATSGYREIRRAVEELESRPELAARAMSAMAMEEQNTSVQQARAWVDRAERIVRASPDQAARAYVRATRLSVMARIGDPAVWELTDELPRQADDPEVLQQTCRALYNVGSYAAELGHDQHAEALLRESLALARDSGSSIMECYASIALLHLDWLAGRWGQIEADIARLKVNFADIAAVNEWAVLIGGGLAGARGQWDLALDLLGRGMEMGASNNEVSLMLLAAAGIARVALARGRPQDAWAAVVPAVEALRRADAWPRSEGMVPIAVEAALAGGHGETARQLATQLEDSLHGVDAPAALADVHLARGMVGREDGETAAAVELFTRAALVFGAIGRPYQVARATEYAARALAESDPHEAAGHYTDAEAIYLRLGAVADAARTQRALREIGFARPTPRGRRTYGEELSPREAQVARLLAQSASNQDIAEALSLSVRTAEHHVARVLKKLHTTRGKIPFEG